MAFKTRKSKGQEETPAPRGQYNNNRRSAVCVSPDPLARGEDPLAVAVQLLAMHTRRFDEVDAQMAAGGSLKTRRDRDRPGGDGSLENFWRPPDVLPRLGVIVVWR